MECASAPSPLPSLSLSPLLFTIPLGDPSSIPLHPGLSLLVSFSSLSRGILSLVPGPPRRTRRRGGRRKEVEGEGRSVHRSATAVARTTSFILSAFLRCYLGSVECPPTPRPTRTTCTNAILLSPNYRISVYLFLFFLFLLLFFFFFSAYIGDWLLEIMLIRVESRLDSRQTRCRLSSLSLFLRTFIKNDAESSIITDDRGKRRTRLPCTRVESTTQFGEKRERERESG